VNEHWGIVTLGAQTGFTAVGLFFSLCGLDCVQGYRYPHLGGDGGAYLDRARRMKWYFCLHDKQGLRVGLGIRGRARVCLRRLSLTRAHPEALHRQCVCGALHCCRIEDSKILHGPFVPSGAARPLEKPDRSSLDAMLHSLHQTIERDWGDFKFEVLSKCDLVHS
jgi:hypothetical protein